jgi:beta-ribofuranosylaminobenzene 5'-phosphate synthase
MATLLPLSQSRSAEICHHVLMQVLPGAASAEFAPFAAGITRIQQLLGQHFAPAQGGSAYTSEAVGRLVEWIGARSMEAGESGHEHGAAIGQSSWGPTGFAIVPSQSQAEGLLDAARAAKVIGPALEVRVVSGRNVGATVIDRRPQALTGL